MNRLCQSSHGNLEAVINIAGYNGNAQRQLVHFYREKMTGQWSACAVVSSNAESGGSIIQSSSKNHPDQKHGDFEVIVIEDGGVLQHYTRDNTNPDDNGVFAWRLSATVTAASGSTPPINAIHAAPLFQSQLSMDNNSDGTTLETVIIDRHRRAIHYRCAQYGTRNNSVLHRHRWCEGRVIADWATGPASIYQTSPGMLMAIVPSEDSVNEYHFEYNTWIFVRKVAANGDPGCLYTRDDKLNVLLRIKHEIHERCYKNHNCYEAWEATSALSASFGRISHTPYHRVLATNPITVLTVLSQPSNSHDIEAIVFHPCGMGPQDAWMVLQWSFSPDTKEWVVRNVVLPLVIGMPL
ncbi:hypothetical protein FHL15_004095 [Xylaria flabelliformis]|uniref:Fucose-specific lectin n=1 Tax=Xylaria flabelliformis TaxID=2512241 RepID=A0A553I470_9PEZI|nr:hypothetical protein FHL15_004095 [Xylaria flabelliformis]